MAIRALLDSKYKLISHFRVKRITGQIPPKPGFDLGSKLDVNFNRMPHYIVQSILIFVLGSLAFATLTTTWPHTSSGCYGYHGNQRKCQKKSNVLFHVDFSPYSEHYLIFIRHWIHNIDIIMGPVKVSQENINYYGHTSPA